MPLSCVIDNMIFDEIVAEPGLVVVHRALFAGIERLRGDRGARELLQRVRTRHVEVGGLCSDIDVDEPGDLEAVIASRRSAREDGPARR